MRSAKNFIISTVSTFIVCLVGQLCHGHCEIPCGIYNDPLRFEMMAEDIQTIEKSMTEIIKLEKEKEKNFNQLVRWVENKGQHAVRLQETVWQYFMCQRIKPVASNDKEARARYISQLTSAHQLLVLAMKAKQSVDLSVVEMLKKELSTFREAYFGKTTPRTHEHKH